MSSPSLSASSPSPLLSKDRITFLDAVRGIALLGILAVNSMGQAQSGIFDENMNLSQPVTGANYFAWFIVNMFFAGSMRGLFSILFGAGAILLLQRLEKSKNPLIAADIYYRRLLWLLAFGLINAFVFLFDGDILYFYAICGLFLFPFRNLSARKLLIPVFLLLAFVTYRFNKTLYERKDTIKNGKAAEILQARHQTLTADQTSNLADWNKIKSRLNTEVIQKQGLEENELVQKANYPKLFVHIREHNVASEGASFYDWYWLDILIFFFAGMALFKSGFILGKNSNLTYIIAAAIGIGSGLYLNYSGLKAEYIDNFDRIKYIENASFNWYEIRRLLQSVGYLSFLILLYKITPFRKILNIFAPVGQMAFTNYLSQSIIMGIIFFGFKWYGKLQRYEIYEVVGVVWIFQIIFSTIWMKYFLYGPFEWVWRSLTYLKSQPFLKMKKINMPENLVEPVRVFAD